MSHATTKGEKAKLEKAKEKLGDVLPNTAQRVMEWLDKPSVKWVRIPLGILMMAAGLVGFLPILGFWMVPLGALLVAQDIPFLRKPARKLVDWVRRKIVDFKAWRKGRKS